MNVNIGGMFLVAQAIGKHMAQQENGGSIIQTASTYGLVGPEKYTRALVILITRSPHRRVTVLPRLPLSD